MKKNWIKKAMAIALSAAMILGVMPEATKPLVVQASTTNTLPTATQFATKAELMTNYDLDNSTAATVQKVIFGQNGSEIAQEWKIAGKDIGINGDNIVLFAATPLGSIVKFNSTTGTKTYDNTKGCTYESDPSTVNANHYGGSGLRQTISDLLKGESYFSTAEQGKMNATTITTKDTYNGKTYTTTDKLYAAYGDIDYGNDYITVGTNSAGSLNSGLTIDRIDAGSVNNWGNSDFWLRAPSDYFASGALRAIPEGDKSSYDVDYSFDVVPAFDLNLSSVIFASAASAAISDGKLSTKTSGADNAFTLRYKSSGNETATINENGSEVTITNATNGMYLVVQNSTGAYAKVLTSGTTSVSSDDISGIADFYNCQVWLESTDATSRITTATVPITKAEPTTTDITSVVITDITAPTVGSNLDTTAACATTGVSSTTPTVTWTPSATTAGYNTAYTASVVLTADAYYQFAESTAATINGNDATSVTKNQDGTLTVTYAFSKTAMDKLTSITTPSPMIVANGTAYEAMNLPSTVGIVTEGNTVTTAAVQWNTTTPASGSYNPSVLTEQSVTLNGTVTCPDSIDHNNVTLFTTIKINISAAGIVGAPSFGIAAGTYTSNQTVELASTTDGATIYYTTDGNEPTTGSSVYSSAISVTGVAGESNSTTIKAIAVKNGMQTSSVSRATYVIEIPAPTYTISVDKSSKDFGTKNAGYTQPAAETFTITNTGNSEVALNQSTSTSYIIGTLSQTILAPGETAAFTVQPNAGLSAGTYNETLTVSTENDTNATVDVSFKVNGAFSVAIDPSSATITSGESQQLEANPTGGSGNYTYWWFVGDGEASFARTKVVTVNPTENTTYKVVVSDSIENKEVAATITVKAQKPAGLTGEKPSDAGANDGKIKNTTTDMEYSTNIEFEPAVTHDCMDTATTELAAGTYYARYKETGTNAASDYVTVVIEDGEHTYATAWSHDDDKHWHEATCSHTDLKADEGAHSFTNYIYNNDATYFQDGTETGTCICGVTHTRTSTGTMLTDSKAPTAKVTVKTKFWTNVMNTVTFGNFFKNTQEIEITASDSESGVAGVQYYVGATSLSEAEITALGDDLWTTYDDAHKPALSKGKHYVYAKVTDEKGNTTYVGTDGIAIYEDSTQNTASIEFTKGATLDDTSDVTAAVTLNGNTIEAIKNGESILTAGTDYTIDHSTGTITFKKSYLNSLSAGDYTFTVSYQPQGESYVANAGNDAPATTTIALKVNPTPTPTTYAVTVNSGTGDGSYAKDATVTITADAAPTGQHFKEWTVVSGGVTLANSTSTTTTFTMPAGAVEVTATYEKDAPVTPTPPTPTGPQIGDKSGWEEIKNDVIDKVKDATNDSEKITITIDMNDTTKIDGGIIDAIKGKNVDVVLDMGDGIKWTINGNSVTSGNVADIDLGVTKNANTIPIDVINTITGQKSTIQISLTHNGEFGFTATLSIGLDASNAGDYANLFYYNTSTGKLEYMNAAKIDANGNASLTFTHASDYSIVIADKVMDGSSDKSSGEEPTTSNENKGTSPQTGDNTPMVWLFILAIVSGTGLIVLGRKKKTAK